MRVLSDTARRLGYSLRLQVVTANQGAPRTDGSKTKGLAAWHLPATQSPVPIEHLDLQQGSFRDTARPLDLALDGPGFLMVRTPAGDRLTRGGSITLDAAGRLTDSHGNPVLGVDGPITVRGSHVEVQDDGSIVVDGAAAGRLRIVDVADHTKLLKEGFGRFVTKAPLDPASTATQVRQGAVEEPNVDPMLAMVDLVTIQRAYSANLEALKAMDSVLASATA